MSRVLVAGKGTARSAAEAVSDATKRSGRGSGASSAQKSGKGFVVREAGEFRRSLLAQRRRLNPRLLLVFAAFAFPVVRLAGLSVRNVRGAASFRLNFSGAIMLQ